MNTGCGWVKLHRKLLSWEWYKDSETLHLFVHLILKANHAAGKWQGVEVGRGELVTGRSSLSAETGLSDKSLRTRLARLKNSGEIAIKTASKYSIITILNYDEYQGMDETEGPAEGPAKGPAKGQQRASKGPAKGHKQEEEELKNENKLPPQPPAWGSETGEEGKRGDDQPPDPTLPKVADLPGQSEQTGKGKRVKKEAPPESEKFLTFWAAYPNKQGRAKAWEKWAEWKLDSQADAIMAALDGFRRSEGWLKENGQFVPHGSTWINQRRWLDMAEVAAPRQSAQQNGSAVNMDEIIRKAIEAKRIETCGSDAL